MYSIKKYLCYWWLFYVWLTPSIQWKYRPGLFKKKLEHFKYYKLCIRETYTFVFSPHMYSEHTVNVSEKNTEFLLFFIIKWAWIFE